jgi:hypothetical protein
MALSIDECYADARFSDIGDLPTGFSPYSFDMMYIRPFSVMELNLLYNGMKAKRNGLDFIIRAVGMVVSCDVNELTDGDFEFVMAWLRLRSYPKGPLLVKWDCQKVNVVDSKTKIIYEGDDVTELTSRDLKLRGFELETCNRENNEIVHNAKLNIISLDDANLTIDNDLLDFPRIGTLNSYNVIVAEDKEHEYSAGLARWIKEGKTLDDKLKIVETLDMVTYNRILECIKEYKHGIEENMELRCRGCDNRVPFTSRPDPLSFFADNSDQNIMDMQYSLLTEFGMQPDLSLPSRQLLYFNSCLAKDKQEAAEKEAIMKSANKRF